MTTTAGKLLLRPREACQLLGFGEKQLRAEMDALNLRFVIVGRRRLIPRADIDAYLEKKRQEWQDLAVAASQSAGKGRRISTATSRSTVVDFDTALKLTSPKKPRP